jgi:hypothetical protein
MKSRHVLSLFISSFLCFLVVSFVTWKCFIQEPKEVSIEQPASTYESIELDMPVQAFLARGVNSPQVSMVRRLFLNQWISLYQGDLLKLLVYGQNATSFAELKKLWEMAVAKEGSSNKACSVIEKTLKIIADDKELIDHVDKTLKEGTPSKLHMLQGRMMSVDKKNKAYKKLKNEYRKALEQWIDEKHGSFIDRMITKV